MPRCGFGNQLENDIIRSARRHFKCDEAMLSSVFKENTDCALEQLWFLKSLDTPLHTACRLKIPSEEAGGFKKMWKHNSNARLLVHCATPRVNQMVLKEILIQQYLSKYDFVPDILSFKVSCSGSLTIPIYEALIEMPLLQKTLMVFMNENPSCEDIFDMLAQIISAIHTLNSGGFMHNDMKPDNVMYISADEYEYTDAFNLRTYKSRYKWHIIDFGLCTSSEGSGDDLFFFCWWLYHKGYKAMSSCNLMPCLKWMLFVPKADLPKHLISQVNCKSTATHIDFTAPIQRSNKNEPNAWLDTYGMTKETLYGIAQQKINANDHRELLKFVYQSDNL